MKKILFLTLVSILIISCGVLRNTDNTKLVKNFEKYYNAKDEESLLLIISDDFKIDYQDYTEINGKEEFKVALKWGKIMNGKNEMMIISENNNQIITTESYTNDRERILKIPSLKLKATYFIKNRKIFKILLDTLDKGRAKIDAKRKIKIDQFKKWCELNIGKSDFEYSENGAREFKNALIKYSSK